MHNLTRKETITYGYEAYGLHDSPDGLAPRVQPDDRFYVTREVGLATIHLNNRYSFVKRLAGWLSIYGPIETLEQAQGQAERRPQDEMEVCEECDTKHNLRAATKANRSAYPD